MATVLPALSALDARPARNDYLWIALVLSLAAHGAVLALRFAQAPAPTPEPTTLEVTLVNTRSEAEPLQPKMLAQDSLNGGGETAAGQASSPLPRTAPEADAEVVLEALRKQQQELEMEQQRLYMQLISQQTTRPAEEEPNEQEEFGEPGVDEQNQESVVLNARISALKERIERYNAEPRRQFTGPTTKAVEYAKYVEAWRQKIELIGTEHYPAEARGKVYGSLQLTVYIRSDGSLEKVEVDKPSSHAILNLAATRIVHLAAPFAPFPQAIARNTDVLAITRTWNFINQTLETQVP